MKGVVTSLVAVAAFVVCATTSQADPIEWSGNNHAYEVFLVEDGVTWSKANGLAQAAGGYLATITSLAEDTFVFSKLINNSTYWFVDWANNSQGPYIGGYQSSGQTSTNTGWQWVTGETWNYTNWETGEPNDGGSGTEGDRENYLQYFNTGNLSGNPSPGMSWNDIIPASNLYGYTGVRAYIVEWNSNPVPEPATLALFGLGIGGVVVARRRRRKAA